MTIRKHDRATALLALVAAAALAPPESAFAQAGAAWSDGPVVVVPAWSGDEERGRAERARALLERALRARSIAIATVSPPSVTAPHERAEVPESLRRQIHECIDNAIVELSGRQPERARREIARCRSLILMARDALLRDDATARELLDECLVRVRAILDDTRTRTPAQARAEAMAEARSCRAEVPDLRPDDRRHTSAVLSLFAQVDEDIARGGGLLVVRHADGRSCHAFVNGRPLGPTPAARRLLPGRYRVQVECDGALVHEEEARVRGASETSVVARPSAYPPAIEPTGPGRVALVYQDRDELNATCAPRRAADRERPAPRRAPRTGSRRKPRAGRDDTAGSRHLPSGAMPGLIAAMGGPTHHAAIETHAQARSRERRAPRGAVGKKGVGP